MRERERECVFTSNFTLAAWQHVVKWCGNLHFYILLKVLYLLFSSLVFDV